MSTVNKNKLVVGLSKRIGKFEPFSWAIQFAGKRPYSHAYIRFYSRAYDRNLVYQASGMAVNFMEYKNFLKQEKVYAEFELSVSKETTLKTIHYAIDHVGEPYGMLEAAGIGIYLLCRFFGLKLKNNPFASNKKTVCAKLVENILNEFLKQGIKINPNVVMPGDIFDAMAACPKAKRIK